MYTYQYDSKIGRQIQKVQVAIVRGTLNIEQAIEMLSESSIRTWDVKMVEFFVQRIKSSNGTNSYNCVHKLHIHIIISYLWRHIGITLGAQLISLLTYLLPVPNYTAWWRGIDRQLKRCAINRKSHAKHAVAKISLGRVAVYSKRTVATGRVLSICLSVRW